MDKEAIEHLENNAYAEVLAARCMELKIPVIPMPNTHALSSIEKHLPAPTRFRGEYKTDSLKEFAAYVKTANVAHRVFVDSENMTAAAYLDLGTPQSPGHAEHKAVLKLKRFPEFIQLWEIHGKPLTQRDFAEFVEDLKHVLSAQTSDAEPIALKDAIAAIRNLTVKVESTNDSTVSDLKATKGRFDSIEASGKDSRRLPAWLVFSGEAYSELGAIDIPCRLGVVTGKTDFTFVLRIASLPLLMDLLAERFKNKVIESLGDAVHIGTFTK